MCTIKVNEIMQDKSYPDAGGVLFDMIEKRLNNNEKIILDLTDVVSLPSMFLNMSLGAFIEKHGIELLRKKISFTQISATQAKRVKEYIERF